MIKVNSLAGYWREVKRLNDELKSDEMLFFRGYSNCAYILLPSCMREPSPAKEDEEYHNILIEHPEEFRKGEHLSNLVKMQHYRAATRLLDFSRNPLISLYFAVESNKNADGEVLCVKVKKSEILHHTSDKALMLACLPPFTDEEKRHIKRFCECHRGLIDDKVIERDDSTGIMKRFLHEICSEFPAFKTAIIGEDLLKSYFIRAYKDNVRMKTQDGAFLICGLEKDNVLKYSKLGTKIDIDAGAKKEILKDLSLVGIADSTIYPGLEREIQRFKKKKAGWIDIDNLK